MNAHDMAPVAWPAIFASCLLERKGQHMSPMVELPSKASTFERGLSVVLRCHKSNATRRPSAKEQLRMELFKVEGRL